MLQCRVHPQEAEEEESDEGADKLATVHPDADTTILFTTGEGWSTVSLCVKQQPTQLCYHTL